MFVGKFVIIRTFSAGCFAGTLESHQNREVILTGARRLWKFAGAQTLSCLAVEGTLNPGECKFPAPVSRIFLPEVIEIIEVSEKGRKSIEAVPVWTA